MQDALISDFPHNHEADLNKEKKDIVGLDNFNQYLLGKGKGFFDKLTTISGDENSFGWHRIEQLPDGKIRKIAVSPGEEAVFTGRNLCNFASFAIYDSLKDRVEDITLDVVTFDTDMYAERWENADHWIQPRRHYVVKATDSKAGTVRYFDSTYKQINHQAGGEIISLTPQDLDRYYRNRANEPIEPKSVLDHKDEILDGLVGWGLTKEKYESLKESI